MKNLIVMLTVIVIFPTCSGGGSGGGNTSDHTISGIMSDLSGTMVLQNNGEDDLLVQANGPFTFSTSLADGAAYNITVKKQPTGQICCVANGTGIISGANVTTVIATCQPTITWNVPISNADGSPLSDVAGYNLYYGTVPGFYTNTIDIGNNTLYPLVNFAAVVPKGTYYIAVSAYTAYDANTPPERIESTYSNEITTTIN